MALEERYYDSPMIEIEDVAMECLVNVPSIITEPGVLAEYTMLGETFKVFAEPEAWAAFDAKFPNQDAQTGDPYKRRYPRKNLPYVAVQDV